MGKVQMKLIKSCISLALFFTLSSFVVESQNKKLDQGQQGAFSCKVNGKNLLLNGAKAQYRTITGGFKQLSLSNDKFDAFVFINPSVRKVELEKNNNREVYVRYIEPGTDRVYKPVSGFVDIRSLDFEKGVVSGVFEMTLVSADGPSKQITVSQGKFENVPIVEIKAY